MQADHAILPANVSRETIDALRHFTALVAKWTARINLVGAADVPELWDRHVLDSVQLYRHAPSAWQHWADLGSGGGFPAIPVAIMAKADRPGARFTLVESDQRKAAFLRTANRELGLDLDVIDVRIDAILPLAADVMTARALAPLDQLLPSAARHLSATGRALFPKGRAAAAEIAQARLNWAFDLVTHPSLTDPEAQILQCERIARA